MRVRSSVQGEMVNDLMVARPDQQHELETPTVFGARDNDNTEPGSKASDVHLFSLPLLHMHHV